MSNQPQAQWMSTYGILTVERLLEYYNIKLSQEDRKKALKDEKSQYHYLLAVPLKNIFNGIISAQIYDYQVYAQKLLIDYKLASKKAPSDDESARVAATNNEYELQLKIEELAELGENFEDTRYAFLELISESQAWLIEASKAQDDFSVSSEVLDFNERAEDLIREFQSLRNGFKSLIKEVTELLRIAPDYFLDTEQLADYQESINFDADVVGDNL